MLFTRPDDLALVTGEMYGATTRAACVSANADAGVDNGEGEAALVENGAVEGEAVMTGFEHLEEYVRGITKAKIDALKAGGGQLPTREVRMLDVGDEDVDREEMVVVPEDEAEGFGNVEEDGDVV